MKLSEMKAMSLSEVVEIEAAPLKSGVTHELLPFDAQIDDPEVTWFNLGEEKTEFSSEEMEYLQSMIDNLLNSDGRMSETETLVFSNEPT